MLATFNARRLLAAATATHGTDHDPPIDHDHRPTTLAGGTFEVPEPEDVEACEEALGRRRASSSTSTPTTSCPTGRGARTPAHRRHDPRARARRAAPRPTRTAASTATAYLHDMFLASDTTVALLSDVPELGSAATRRCRGRRSGRRSSSPTRSPSAGAPARAAARRASPRTSATCRCALDDMAATRRDRRRRRVQGVHGVGPGPAGLRPRRPGHRAPGRRAGPRARREGDLRPQGPAAARVRPPAHNGPRGHRRRRRAVPRHGLRRVPRRLRAADDRGPVRPGRRRRSGVDTPRQGAGRPRHPARTPTSTPSSAPPGGRCSTTPTEAAHTLGKLLATGRRGQRDVGHRRHLVRLAAAADHGVPRLPDRAGAPGAATATRRSPRS